jgi:hypothetical protein
VERTGPYGDRVVGGERYLAFLADAVPEHYANDVHLIVAAADGRAGFARVTEHLRYTDKEFHLEESYVFALDAEARLERVEVFCQFPEADPGGFGSARDLGA